MSRCLAELKSSSDWTGLDSIEEDAGLDITSAQTLFSAGGGGWSRYLPHFSFKTENVD